MTHRPRCVRSARPSCDRENCRNTWSRSYPNWPSYRSGIPLSPHFNAKTTSFHCLFPVSLFYVTHYIRPEASSNKGSHLHLLLLNILQLLPGYNFLYLFVCHFSSQISIQFSSLEIINSDRFLKKIWNPLPPLFSPGSISLLLCHLRAVFTSCLIVLYIFHIVASGLEATTHTAGG